MRQIFRRRGLRVVAAAALLAVLLVGGYGMYLANMAGRLPWQADPTRIAITPFADIPGFGAAAPPSPTPTPEPSTAGAVATGS
jgi:hypothetical protein